MVASYVPDISGSINSGVDSIIGGVNDWKTGQALQNIPRAADGSIDYRAAAAALMRTNPAMATQFMKLEELRGQQDYRRDSIDVQRRHLDLERQKVDLTAENAQNVQFEDKTLHFRRGQLVGWTDNNTGTSHPAQQGGGAQPQQPSAGGGASPPPEAIKILQQRPETAAAFEKHFSLPAGSAQRYLGGGGGTQTPAPAPAAPAPAPASETQAPSPGATYAPGTAPPAIVQPKREPGESYSAWKEREKKLASERGNIDQKELKEADDAIFAARETAGNLVKLIRLNDKSLSGWTAAAAPFAAQFGNEKASNTLIMDNMLKQGALSQLSTTFGKAPSDKEHKILIELQGSVTAPAAVKKDIYARALEIAQRRIIYNQKYANAVRAGNAHLMPAYTDNLQLEGLP